MKIVRVWQGTVACVLALAVSAATTANSGPMEGEDLHRLIGLLDYVGRDYPAAVHQGEIVDAFEYREQLMLLEAATELAEGTGGSLPTFGPEQSGPDHRLLRHKLTRLTDLVHQRAPADSVGALAQAIRWEVIAQNDLVLFPSSAPSFERGRTLYGMACAACHGAWGTPPRDRVRSMVPPPSDFGDPAVTASLSPYRIFNVITFGVEGTAMPSYEGLPVSERWDIAFYTQALRHLEQGQAKRVSAGPFALLRSSPSVAVLSGVDSPSLPPGSPYPGTSSDGGPRSGPAWSSSPAAPSDTGAASLPASPRLLATLSDAELTAHLVDQGLEKSQLENALAYLRTEAPYTSSESEEAMARAIGMLRHAVRIYKGGDPRRARSTLLDAYLQGFEPFEPLLASKDRGLVAEVEVEFLGLRTAMSRRAPASEIQGQGRRLEKLLALVQLTLEAREPHRLFALSAGLLIVVREGFEAALIVAALLAVLARMGRRDAARHVHGGWILALGAGGVTWAIAHRFLQLRGAAQESLEGLTSLLAAAVLFIVSFWLISRAETHRWMSYLRSRVERGLLRGSGVALAVTAFLAVYREAFETVLFYEALLSDDTLDPSQVAAGFVLGCVALVGLFLLLRGAIGKLPIGPFFATTGLLLYTMCIVFTGQGLQQLRQVGALPYLPTGSVRLPWLGLYPDALGMGVQGALVLLLAAASGVVFVRRRRAVPKSAREAEAPGESTPALPVGVSQSGRSAQVETRGG